MSRYTVYGLRLRGDTEARYIGFTSKPLADRLATHLGSRRCHIIERSAWIRENLRQVEIFEISTAETEIDARRKEREAVAFCLALNHRLFNRWLVPTDRRQLSPVIARARITPTEQPDEPTQAAA